MYNKNIDFIYIKSIFLLLLYCQKATDIKEGGEYEIKKRKKNFQSPR